MHMSVNDTPNAAIVIAAYNAQATIARAVRSALAQAHVAEVCVVDDASSDATLETARACDDGTGRLILLRQDVNGGPSPARNRAMEATRAPWIGILDADDYLLDGRIARMLARHQDADFIADTLLRTLEGQEPRAAWESAAPRLISFAEFVDGNGPHKALDLGFIKPLMRRSLLDLYRIRYRPEMRLGEDYELYARALAHGARLLLTQPEGYVSVERAGSISQNHSEIDLQRLRDCDDALAKIRPLTPPEKSALRRHRVGVDHRLQWRLFINAVKARDAGGLVGTLRSPSHAVYMTTRLVELAWIRSRKHLSAS